MGTFKSNLIALVENERDLWDPTSEGFKLKSVRLRCCIRIHEKLLSMGYTRSVDELKGTWKNLRDAYKRYRNKPTGPNSQRPWVLAPNLKFLDEGNVDEVPFSNLDIDNDKDYAEESGDGELFECSNASDLLPSGTNGHISVQVPPGGSQSQIVQSRRVAGGKRPYEEAFPSSSSYLHDVVDPTRLRGRKDKADSGNKFAAFGYFVGTVLNDAPEQTALQKMQAIWDILFNQAESTVQQSQTYQRSMLDTRIKEEE
ncbi:hypothetical protein OESDEN_12832 [Oesophagostomum dentatum]|uniref:MADF domain-containing protein n=1 Tax=Oesophagostomum dentatum TaxID=61180 RepID=A0A0B1SU17_OESDE|nr:hypothetical protein OESDEN_12832 [Oesophagostomum dentatum]